MANGPELPSYAQFLAEHIPILGLLVSKGQETLGDKGLRFLVNGSAAVLLVAVFGWSFYIHGQVKEHSIRLERLETLEKEIETNNKRLSKIRLELQSINSHLMNPYQDSSKDAN